MRHTALLILIVMALIGIGVVGLNLAGSDPAPTAVPAPTTPPSPGPPSTVSVTEGPVTIPDGILLAVGAWETNWNRRTIELDELVLGIPATDPRDLIRPLDFPAYESLEGGDAWLVDNEIGILFEAEGTARFYPLRILTAHEIVNDEVGGVPFAITYCPLCNTAAAFDRRVGGDVLRFGVSGLLRKSDLVMWDDVTQSLWQQISGEGIVGDLAGTRLNFLATSTVTWGDFKAAHPEGEVLSRDTGSGSSYGSNGYAGYTSLNAPFNRFFSDDVDSRFPAMERVVGVRVGDATKAYPFSILSKDPVANDVLGDTPFTVWWADTGAADNFGSEQPGAGGVIGTGIAFLRTVGDKVLTFGSNGDDTFVDAETGTTWSLFGEGIGGPLAGTQLETALHQNEFWFAWSAFNAGSPVYGA